MAKVFVGYCILGASNEQEAKEQLGLQVWMTSKPGWFKRFVLKSLMKIYWVDRRRELEHMGIKEKPQHHTSFNKYAQRKPNRTNEHKGGNSEQGSRS